MRVRIVSYEDVNGWILGKFARKLNEELNRLGIHADISNVTDDSADINHHIIYTYCDTKRLRDNDSLMITHVDEIKKANLLKDQLKKSMIGICMSNSTMNELIAFGLPAEKLCVVNPAHDNVMKAKKLIIGITSKVQPTGSKREAMLVNLCKNIDSSLFEFVIMGSGWERIISTLNDIGITTTYYDQFDYTTYTQIVPNFDYYLYLGQDEGSMGFIDALAAGVKTIVTSQGFHLDAHNGITHPFNTEEELLSIFEAISTSKKNLIKSVSNWTWQDYAKKHIEVWHYLLTKEKTVGKYQDGLNSMLQRPLVEVDVSEYKKNLKKGQWRRFFYVASGRAKKMTNIRWVAKKIKATFFS